MVPSPPVAGSAPASRRAVHIPPAVAQWIKLATAHAGAGRFAAAIEHLAGAAVVDIQQHNQTFLAGAFEAAFLADRYEDALWKAGLVSASMTPRAEAKPLKVLYVLGSVVEGQAASTNVARFMALHGKEQFVCSVLVTEELTQRTPALTALKHEDSPSARVGEATLVAMRATVGVGAKVEVIEATGTYLDGAKAAIKAARAMEADLAVFVGSPACPIQAAMAAARVAPAQVNMCIGVPLLVRGIDAVIYNNPRRQRDDAEFIGARGIRLLGVETSGGDAAGGKAVTAVTRASLGIPDGAVILASASNKLPERMTAGRFAADLGRFLSEQPNVWWVGIGRGDFAKVLEAMRRAAAGPVTDRVKLVGAAADVKPIVKACDIFLNEYPEGGGNSVIEAMGCGVPVVAMTAGTRHAECIGAELVGPPSALTLADPAAYWARVREWVMNAKARQAAGAAMQVRAVERLDYAAVAKGYEACYAEVWGHVQKTTAAKPAVAKAA